MQNFIFAFDLDGTVTQAELLPLLGRELGIYEDIMQLTRKTLNGEIEFSASFRHRFEMLAPLPLERIQKIVKGVPLSPEILEFIKFNSESCRIVTGNLDCWIAPLRSKIDCEFISSCSTTSKGVTQLQKILDKGEAMRSLALRYPDKTLVAIGESAGDIPMFMQADIGIAYAGVHEPVPALLESSAYVCRSAGELCALLRSIKMRPCRNKQEFVKLRQNIL